LVFSKGRGETGCGKREKSGKRLEKHPSGAKAHVYFSAIYGTTEVVP
jgi:hypothetical protein